MKSKYEQAFDAFEPTKSSAEIVAEIEKIISDEMASIDRLEAMKFLYSTIDLTTLTATDTISSVKKMVSEVNERHQSMAGFPTVAAICVYPSKVATVKDTLDVPGVGIAAVTGGFPASQTLLDIKLVETSMTVKTGATEIDIVLNLGDFLEGNYAAVTEEIEEQKDYAASALLKVILETGALKEPEAIRKASILALFSRADFLKTSTGKEYPGASLEAAYVMCHCIRQYAEKHGRKVGVKFSGGIRTAEEALQYYCLVKSILGKEWLTNKLFRIGASSLEKNLREAIMA